MNDVKAKPKATPAEDKKPAESFEEVAKDVKVAAQEYLDARQDEKQDPVDPMDPEAAKIEEVSQNLDAIAETIATTPDEEIVESISDEDAVALVAAGVLSDESDKKGQSSPSTLGRNLALGGGAIFLGSLAVAGGTILKTAAYSFHVDELKAAKKVLREQVSGAAAVNKLNKELKGRKSEKTAGHSWFEVENNGEVKRVAVESQITIPAQEAKNPYRKVFVDGQFVGNIPIKGQEVIAGSNVSRDGELLKIPEGQMVVNTGSNEVPTWELREIPTGQVRYETNHITKAIEGKRAPVPTPQPASLSDIQDPALREKVASVQSNLKQIEGAKGQKFESLKKWIAQERLTFKYGQNLKARGMLLGSFVGMFAGIAALVVAGGVAASGYALAEEESGASAPVVFANAIANAESDTLRLLFLK